MCHRQEWCQGIDFVKDTEDVKGENCVKDMTDVKEQCQRRYKCQEWGAGWGGGAKRCKSAEVSAADQMKCNAMNPCLTLCKTNSNYVFYSISFLIFFGPFFSQSEILMLFWICRTCKIGKYAFLSKTPRIKKENKIGWRWILKLKTVWTTKQCQVAAMHNVQL